MSEKPVVPYWHLSTGDDGVSRQEKRSVTDLATEPRTENSEAALAISARDRFNGVVVWPRFQAPGTIRRRASLE